MHFFFPNVTFGVFKNRILMGVNKKASCGEGSKGYE